MARTCMDWKEQALDVIWREIYLTQVLNLLAPLPVGHNCKIENNNRVLVSLEPPLLTREADRFVHLDASFRGSLVH